MFRLEYYLPQTLKIILKKKILSKRGTDGIQQENQIKPVKNGEGNSKEGVIKVESISDGVSGD